MCALPPKGRAGRRSGGRNRSGIGLLQSHAIHKKDLVTHGERVAGKPHDSLDEPDVIQVRCFEDDDIATRRRRQGGEAVVRERYPPAHRQLVGEDIVSFHERGGHGGRRDAERLNGNRGHQQKDEKAGGGHLRGFGDYAPARRRVFGHGMWGRKEGGAPTVSQSEAAPPASLSAAWPPPYTALTQPELLEGP